MAQGLNEKILAKVKEITEEEMMMEDDINFLNTEMGTPGTLEHLLPINNPYGYFQMSPLREMVRIVSEAEKTKGKEMVKIVGECKL